MKYIKFNIDEMHQRMVFCEYRDFSKGKGPMLTRTFPLDTIIEHEPRINDLIKGEEIGIYYELKGNIQVKETQYIDRVETIDDETVEYIISFVEKACVNEAWDELLKPPTVDQQVEDFIKEFFDEDEKNEEPLEKKDFLAEFFQELEEEDKQEATSKE
tara:strand:- start:3008 stop:3481 length:474 start_codon:yes stop_codon:yes gene_type:complete